jgi:hypothetical protein
MGVLQYLLSWLRWHTFNVGGMRELSYAVTQSGMSGLSMQMQFQLMITQRFAELAAGEYEKAKRYFEGVRDRLHPSLKSSERAEAVVQQIVEVIGWRRPFTRVIPFYKADS